MEEVLNNLEISIDRASCFKGNNMVFENITYSVKNNEMMLIMGPNGCGKTTFIKSICGIQKLESGSIKLNSIDINSDSSEHLNNILYIGHKNSLNNDLTVFENLEYLCAFDKSVSNILEQEIKKSLEYFGIAKFKNYLVSKISEGNKKKVSLTRLLLSNKKIWLLDEPLSFIDSEGNTKILDLFNKHINNSGLIILSSHIDISKDVTNTKKYYMENS